VPGRFGRRAMVVPVKQCLLRFACVLYAEIVEGRVKKFGTTDSVVARQSLNMTTINNILQDD
jgi:hypothetical protein